MSFRRHFVIPHPIGGDRQPGTLTEPFGSLQAAWDIAEPGDTILVRGGLYALDAPVVKQFNQPNLPLKIVSDHQ